MIAAIIAACVIVGYAVGGLLILWEESQEPTLW